MGAIRKLVYNLIQKSFYGGKTKIINILTIFFIFYKNDVKIFLK